MIRNRKKWKPGKASFPEILNVKASVLFVSSHEKLYTLRKLLQLVVVYVFKLPLQHSCLCSVSSYMSTMIGSLHRFI